MNVNLKAILSTFITIILSIIVISCMFFTTKIVIIIIATLLFLPHAICHMFIQYKEHYKNIKNNDDCFGGIAG